MYCRSRVLSQATPCGIRGGQSENETGVSRDLRFSFSSTIPQLSHTHISFTYHLRYMNSDRDGVAKTHITLSLFLCVSMNNDTSLTEPVQ